MLGFCAFNDLFRSRYSIFAVHFGKGSYNVYLIVDFCDMDILGYLVEFVFLCIGSISLHFFNGIEKFEKQP